MYVIFPADEVVYLSYGRVIYIPSRLPPREDQVISVNKASCSSDSRISNNSLPSFSTNSSTSRESTKSLPVKPIKIEDAPKSNSLSSLNPSICEKKRKQFPVGFTHAEKSCEKSNDSIKTVTSESNYPTFQSKSEDSKIYNIDIFSQNTSQLFQPSISKSVKTTTSKPKKTPNLMINEINPFTFQVTSTSKEHPTTSSSKIVKEISTFQGKSNSDVSSPTPVKSVNKGPLPKIDSDRSTQLKIISEKSSQKLSREKISMNVEKGKLTRSISLKPNISQQGKPNYNFERGYRELTPPTNSSREKSPPSKTPTDSNQKNKFISNKSVRLLKKPLQFTKPFKEITASNPVGTQTSPNSKERKTSFKSLSVDFDSLFRKETSPAKVSLKSLAPNFEEDNLRKHQVSKDKKALPSSNKRGVVLSVPMKNGHK